MLTSPLPLPLAFRFPTVEQIRSSEREGGGSPCEYLFWTSPTGDHVRLRGLLHLITPSTPSSPFVPSPRLEALLPSHDWEGFRSSSWENEMSAHLRATFLNPPPGSDWPEGGEKELHERVEVGDEGEKEAKERFAVLVVEVEVVDWSETNVSFFAKGGAGEGGGCEAVCVAGKLDMSV